MATLWCRRLACRELIELDPAGTDLREDGDMNCPWHNPLPCVTFTPPDYSLPHHC